MSFTYTPVIHDVLDAHPELIYAAHDMHLRAGRSTQEIENWLVTAAKTLTERDAAHAAERNAEFSSTPTGVTPVTPLKAAMDKANDQARAAHIDRINNTNPSSF